MIFSAYDFIMEQYRPGDKIFLFGKQSYFLKPLNES